MAARSPLVIGADGLPQQLQAADTLALAALGYTSGSTAAGTWFRRPDGLINQHGTATLVGGTVTVTFPIPFPTACFHVDPVPVVAGSASNAGVNAWLASAPTKTQAVIVGRAMNTVLGVLSLSSGAFDVRWHAIGN